jgi:hypothetical protein
MHNVHSLSDGDPPNSYCLVRFVLFLAVFVLVMTVAHAQSTDAAAAAAPQIEFTVEQVDLGQVDRGAVVTAHFEVRNTGNADLRILKVSPG